MKEMTFRRREWITLDPQTTFEDPTGQFVGAFGSPNPTHPSSFVALKEIYGYLPADPDNEEHRRMFPQCIVKDGYLQDLEGNIAMIYPKEFWEDHMKKLIENRKAPLGTKDTYDAVITPEHIEEGTGLATGTPEQQKLEKEISDAVRKAVAGAPEKVKKRIELAVQESNPPSETSGEVNDGDSREAKK